MKPTLLLCAALLAACGSGADSQPANDAAADSAALEVVNQPPVGQTTPSQSPAVENVKRRLDQAEKDAAARQNEAMEQVRQAEGGTSTP